MIMPERIAQIPKTVFHLNIAALLKSAFSICRSIKGTVLYKYILASIKRPLLIKGLIFNPFHIIPPNILQG